MDHLIHRSPSVGSLVKKIMSINAALDAEEIIQIIRQSTRSHGPGSGDYAQLQVVDEKHALSLAKASLAKPESFQ